MMMVVVGSEKVTRFSCCCFVHILSKRREELIYTMQMSNVQHVCPSFFSTFIPKCSSNIHANCPMLSMLSVTIIIPLLVSVFTIYTRGKKRGRREKRYT